MADTILVIDDSVTVRTAVRWVTESEGYEVLEASSLQEARTLLEANQPDKILLDYHLPDGKGVDFCAELRQDQRFASTPVILLHGSAHPFDPADARSARATGALRKPFRSETLLDLLESDASSAQEQPTVQTDAVPESKDADDEENIFSTADIIDEAPRAPAPPAPAQKPVRTRSGAFRTPPMPGSGLHRIPPPGGQSVKVAGRGTMPRSPSGAFRAVDAEVPAQEDAPSRAPATTPASQESVPRIEPAAPQPAPTPQAQNSSPRHEPTAEVNVLDEKDIDEAPREGTHKTFEISEAQLRAQIEDVLGDVIEEKLEAVIEKELPNIARRALAGLLRTELNEQIVRLGVTRRVQQFLDKDLPDYAKRAVDQRVARNDED